MRLWLGAPSSPSHILTVATPPYGNPSQLRVTPLLESEGFSSTYGYTISSSVGFNFFDAESIW
jgi:hypothetical protein